MEVDEDPWLGSHQDNPIDLTMSSDSEDEDMVGLDGRDEDHAIVISSGSEDEADREDDANNVGFPRFEAHPNGFGENVGLYSFLYGRLYRRDPDKALITLFRRILRWLVLHARSRNR